MQEINKRAFNEIVEILNYTDKDIVKKIPLNFRKFLFENRDKSYNPNINFNDAKWEDSVLDDTKALMGLIYRDYIVTKEERKKLLLEEEQELKEKYNPDNLFKNNKEKQCIEKNISNQNIAMLEYKEPLLKKIINKIKNLFRTN